MARSSLGPTLASAAPAAPSRPLAGVWTSAATSGCRPGIKLGTSAPAAGLVVIAVATAENMGGGRPA